jgi:hypothetical protein
VRDSSTDYLAFCAAKDELRRRSQSAESLLMRALVATPARIRPEGARNRAEWREVEDERFQSYVVACYAVAARFNGEDRNVLRLAGILPTAFFDDVEAEMRQMKKHKGT